VPIGSSPIITPNNNDKKQKQKQKMKTIKNLLIAMLLLISISSFSQSNYIEAKNYAISQGYTIATESHANVIQSNFMYNWRTFYSNTEYLVYASSDDIDVTDVDIYIENPNGSIFVRDNDNNRVSVVTFELYETIQLKVIVYNHASLTPNYASIIRYFVAYK